jgi:hypothetical protein
MTKNELLETIREIDPTAADEMRKAKANKAVMQAWLDDATGEEEEEGGRGMAGTLAKYRTHYTTSVSPSGRKSLNNGDPIAAVLEGRDATEVLRIAEELLDFAPGELVAKYERLNPGQRRMNGGNRIRSAIKRGDITIDQLEAAVH